MATMYPPEFAGEYWAEEQVYDALRALPDPWIVVHDVAFPVEQGQDPTEDGQADLVLLHPEYGVLIIEVKGGAISADKGEWTSTNRDGVHSIKDPFKQVTRIKFGLKDQLNKRMGLNPWCMHGVAFPSTSSADGPIGLQEPDLVMYSGDLAEPEAAISRMVDYHQPRPQHLSISRLDEIAGRLAPTVTIEPTLVDAVDGAVADLIKLTTQQRAYLQMARALDRVWISGGAGTGKTILAVEKARQLAADGQDVLLLCFTQPLGTHLAKSVADLPTVTAGNYHHVATESAGARRPPDCPENEWLETGLNEAFLDYCIETETRWDAVIIDEGQDFRHEWLETLEQVLVAEDSLLMLFTDENQNLFQSVGAAGLPTRPLLLDVNCRNTPQINRRAAGSIGLEVECLKREDGLEPTLAIVEGENDLLKAMRSEVHRLISAEHIPSERVAILSTSRPLIDDLQGRRIGRWNAVRVFEEGLVCETVHRFKGLEADAVVLLLPDHGPFDEKLAYVGMSRPRAVLSVICGEETAAVLRWD